MLTCARLLCEILFSREPSEVRRNKIVISFPRSDAPNSLSRNILPFEMESRERVRGVRATMLARLLAKKASFMEAEGEAQRSCCRCPRGEACLNAKWPD